MNGRLGFFRRTYRRRFRTGGFSTTTSRERGRLSRSWIPGFSSATRCSARIWTRTEPAPGQMKARPCIGRWSTISWLAIALIESTDPGMGPTLPGRLPETRPHAIHTRTRPTTAMPSTRELLFKTLKAPTRTAAISNLLHSDKYLRGPVQPVPQRGIQDSLRQLGTHSSPAFGLVLQLGVQCRSLHVELQGVPHRICGGEQGAGKRND